MASPKMPFISSVRLAEIDDSYVVPTCLYYDGNRSYAGREAREKCASPEFLIEDFKLELGRDNTSSLSKSRQSQKRSTAGLAKDFLDQTIDKVSLWLKAQGQPLPRKILVAEPLSIGGKGNENEGWLANYRRSIRIALDGKFDEVDFLPEPFAAFQYYRYGLRHPAVAENRKHIALVLDFGGGTFDVSVIETTRQGDIRVSGANSKPLGAQSIAVGGFYINRLLAEDLLMSSLEKRVEKSDVRKSVEYFTENKSFDEDLLSKLSDKQQSFFKHYRVLLQDVEKAKVFICNGIANWSLSADVSGLLSCAIRVPSDPFQKNPNFATGKLDAGKMKKTYEDKIWSAKLKEAILTTIKRASPDLRGQEIGIVLLSGGSSNIRWLKYLIERDLHNKLVGAQVIELNSDFAEIVTKGFAIECARRKYTGGQGDFRAVTYNRLCLLLRSDNG